MTPPRLRLRHLTVSLLSATCWLGVPAMAWAEPPVHLAQTASPVTRRPRVAVMELRAINVNGALSAATSEALRSALIQLGRITVIEREQIEQVLREQQFNRTGLVEGASAVALGRLLGANAIVVGSVTTFGTSYLINARALDATTGEALAASQVSTVQEEEIPALLHQMARTLFPETAQAASQPVLPVPTATPVPAVAAAPVPVVPVTPVPIEAQAAPAMVPAADDPRPTGLLKSEALLKGLLVPSWGEFYAQEPVRGWISLAIIGLGLAMTQLTSTSYAPSSPAFGSDLSPSINVGIINRPLLTPGLLLIGLGWFGSAIDAFVVTQETAPAAGAATP